MHYVTVPALRTSIAGRRSRQPQMKNTIFSPAFQRLVASNPNCLVQFSRGHLGSPDESDLDTAHQTEVTTPRKQPTALNLRSALHFAQNQLSTVLLQIRIFLPRE
jgi:hypothetical protein